MPRADEARPIGVSSSINDLRSEVVALRGDVRELQRICSRMDDHITFVNGTYNAVRSPMSWIFSRVNRMMGITASPDLPRIENHDPDADE